MKKVALFIAIITLSISGCQFKSHKLTKTEAPEAIPAKVVAPTFSVEKRAEKYALFFKGRLISSFQYDSINIDGIYPILSKGQEKYVFLEREEKVFGPFAEIKILDEKTIKISTAGHQKNGFLNANGEEKLFDYYHVYKDPQEERLFWVMNKSGQRGLISTGFAVREDSLILPTDNYFYAEAKACSDGYSGMSYQKVTVRYFKDISFGKTNIRVDWHNHIPKYSNSVKETKLKDLFGYNAKIIVVNAAKKALVSSEKGYGLINLDGVILVPAAYKNYQKIGDSAYIFSNADETLKVDLNGKKI